MAHAGVLGRQSWLCACGKSRICRNHVDQRNVMRDTDPLPPCSSTPLKESSAPGAELDQVVIKCLS